MANEENIQEIPVINKIKVSRKDDGSSIIDIEIDGKTYPVTFEDIAPYWKTGLKSDICNVGVFVQGTLVLCWCVNQTGNKGVIFVWESTQKKIVHVSEGSFTRKVVVFRHLVFSLREVPKQDINDLVLCCSPGPMLDGDNKGMVQAIPLNIKIFDKKFNIDNYKLGVKDDSIIAGFRNEVRVIKASDKPNPNGEAPKMTS
ncbi:MAG: hypothetical protein E7509_02130 [Ruminococcus sp.]|nr:hypothetical protein [Ruminococcus sp.]